MLNKNEFKMIKKFYKQYVKKYKVLFAVIILLSLISSTLMLANPYLLGKLIDNALQGEINLIIEKIIIMLIIYVVNAIISFIFTYTNNYISNILISNIKKDAYIKIIRLNMVSFNQNTIGNYMSFFEGDTVTISSFYINTVLSLVNNMFTTIVAGIFVFSISVKLSLIGLLSIPIAFYINYYFGKKLRNLQMISRECADLYTSNIQESFAGIKEIKGLSLEKLFEHKNNIGLKDIFKINMKYGVVSSFGKLAQMSTGFLMQLGVYFTGCYMIINKQLTVGLFTSYNNYLDRFLSSLHGITHINISLQTVLVSMNRFEKFIEDCRIESITDCCDQHKFIGNVRMEKVCFSYDKTNNTLNNLNLCIEPNELVAIVGPNGSGKSTLFSLLMKFYKQDNGEIFFDDKNINEIDLSTLRENVTLIQQYPSLFNDTIMNNLLLVQPCATEEQIHEACKRVQLYSTIINMPKGFNTIIGEQGFKLSGGQRQQLAIARGLLRNTKIFLFDEISSNIDGQKEKNLLRIIKNLSCNHTVLIIAHRASTITQMPRIVVIDKGINIAEGNHRHLLEICEEYKDLFDEMQEAEDYSEELLTE